MRKIISFFYFTVSPFYGPVTSVEIIVAWYEPVTITLFVPSTVSCAVTAPLVNAPLAPVPLLRTTPFCLKILILELPISYPSVLFATEI